MPYFKPEEKARVLSALKTLTAFVETMEVSKSCLSCLHWDRGCKLAGRKMPPEQVQKEGCPAGIGMGLCFKTLEHKCPGQTNRGCSPLVRQVWDGKRSQGVKFISH